MRYYWYISIYTPFGAEGLRDIQGWSGWGWGGDDNIPGGGGVGMMTFLARAHMEDATQLAGWGWGRLSFLGCSYRVSAFGALHHIQASNKHSAVCHL